MIARGLRRARYRFAYLSRARRPGDLRRDWRLEQRGDYSFAPFLATDSLFVHVPKCAGVSICRALYGSLAGGHTTMRDYETIFSAAERDRFFTFACVRNPWDRLLSAYEFLRAGGFNAADAAWSEAHLAGFGSFERFVRDGLGRREIIAWPHFRPQVAFLQGGDGRIALDFLARFETLARDFAVIRARVGGSALPRDNRRASVRDYRTAYDTAMVETVATIYRADIDTFGYAFDA